MGSRLEAQDQVGGFCTEPDPHTKYYIRSLPSRSSWSDGSNKHPNRNFQYHGIGKRKVQVGDNHKAPWEHSGATFCLSSQLGWRWGEREGRLRKASAD